MKVMKNHCIDMLRKGNKLLNVDMPEKVDAVHQSFEAEDLRKYLKKRLSELPLNQKMIVELKDFQGFSYEEISEILQIPVTTLRVQLSRARKYLIKSIDHELKKN